MSFSMIEIIVITQIKANTVYYNVKNSELGHNPVLIILLLLFPCLPAR